MSADFYKVGEKSIKVHIIKRRACQLFIKVRKNHKGRCVNKGKVLQDGAGNRKRQDK